MYMMTISVAEARARFSKIVDSASSTHERFEVTRNGSRAAVLLGADDFDALIETVEILGDAALVARISAGLGELERGETETADMVLEAMTRAGRMSR
ncbi:MAG: type II toxin-antitoxin system Phd/YefM family antitoxin [Actinomycetota bacterium]